MYWLVPVARAGADPAKPPSPLAAFASDLGGRSNRPKPGASAKAHLHGCWMIDDLSRKITSRSDSTDGISNVRRLVCENHRLEPSPMSGGSRLSLILTWPPRLRNPAIQGRVHEPVMASLSRGTTARKSKSARLDSNPELVSSSLNYFRGLRRLPR